MCACCELTCKREDRNHCYGRSGNVLSAGQNFVVFCKSIDCESKTVRDRRTVRGSLR